MKKLDHKLIFVPLWLRKIQKVYGFSDKELLSFSPLLDILSVEDVANYYAANNIFNTDNNFLPFSLTFSNHDFVGTSKVDTGKSNIEETLTHINNLAIMAVNDFNNAESYTNSMTSMIKAMQFPLNQYDEDQDLHENIRDNYVFELLPIDEEHIGITFVCDEDSKTVNECLVQSIKLLCSFYPLETVAQTPLFNYWVSTLNKVT